MSFCLSGHYWAYIYSTENNDWLKFNDITCSEASWEELEKESIGGYHNASAYCLMYIDVNRSDTLLGKRLLYWALVSLYLMLFMAIDKHDQSAGVCK